MIWIYIVNVLSSLYGIIMDSVIDYSGHGKNVVGGINEAEKHYLKGRM